MRQSKSYIIFSIVAVSIIVVLSIHSFRRVRLAYIVKGLSSQTIELPPNMMLVKDKTGSMAGSQRLDSLLHLIYYFGPNECSGCALQHLSANAQLFDLADSLENQFDVIVIVSPPASFDEYQRNAILYTEVGSMPFYLDSDNLFQKLNSLPEDKRFHAFLVDSDMRPVMIGDPCSGEKLWSLFSSILECSNRSGAIISEL